MKLPAGVLHVDGHLLQAFRSVRGTRYKPIRGKYLIISGRLRSGYRFSRLSCVAIRCFRRFFIRFARFDICPPSWVAADLSNPGNGQVMHASQMVQSSSPTSRRSGLPGSPQKLQVTALGLACAPLRLRRW
jgi:hypothetical protein